jgi:membrane protein required for colicin V production
MILDIIIIALLALAAYRGWTKGAISLIASLIILIAAILLATAFGSDFGKMIGAGNSVMRPVLGFFILFVLLFLAGQFLKKFLTPKRGFLGRINNFFGLILGIVRAVLVLGLLFALLRIFEIPSAKTVSESKTYPIVLKSSSLIVSQLKPLAGHMSNDTFESMPADSTHKP